MIHMDSSCLVKNVGLACGCDRDTREGEHLTAAGAAAGDTTVMTHGDDDVSRRDRVTDRWRFACGAVAGGPLAFAGRLLKFDRRGPAAAPKIIDGWRSSMIFCFRPFVSFLNFYLEASKNERIITTSFVIHRTPKVFV